MMISIRGAQNEVSAWNQRQPWKDDPPVVVVVGLGEECGEVQRAILKMHQGIRGTEQEWREEAAKEMGDVFIKLCALADSLGMDLEDCIAQRWDVIRERNFTKDPQGHGIDKA